MGQLSWLIVLVALAVGSGVRVGLTRRLRQREAGARIKQRARCRAALGLLVYGAVR